LLSFPFHAALTGGKGEKAFVPPAGFMLKGFCLSFRALATRENDSAAGSFSVLSLRLI
jgi:hypothetical protein